MNEDENGYYWGFYHLYDSDQIIDKSKEFLNKVL